MSELQLSAMQAGREREQLRRDTLSAERVSAFTAWLKAGSVLREIPCVPSDLDYAAARRRGMRV